MVAITIYIILIHWSLPKERPKVEEITISGRVMRRFAHRAEEELYDLASDPYELTNIAGRKEVALVQSQLRRNFSLDEQQGDYLTFVGRLHFKPKMHPMDQPNPRFKNMPDELIGSLEEHYVDAHAVTQ